MGLDSEKGPQVVSECEQGSIRRRISTLRKGIAENGPEAGEGEEIKNLHAVHASFQACSTRCFVALHGTLILEIAFDSR